MGWIAYPICLLVGLIAGVVISRILDKKFDEIQTKLEEILGKIKPPQA